MRVRSSSPLSSLQHTPERVGSCLSHFAGSGAGCEPADSFIDQTGGLFVFSASEPLRFGRGTEGAEGEGSDMAGGRDGDGGGGRARLERSRGKRERGRTDCRRADHGISLKPQVGAPGRLENSDVTSIPIGSCRCGTCRCDKGLGFPATNKDENGRSQGAELSRLLAAYPRIGQKALLTEARG